MCPLELSPRWHYYCLNGVCARARASGLAPRGSAVLKGWNDRQMANRHETDMERMEMNNLLSRSPFCCWRILQRRTVTCAPRERYNHSHSFSKSSQYNLSVLSIVNILVLHDCSCSLGCDSCRMLFRAHTKCVYCASVKSDVWQKQASKIRPVNWTGCFALASPTGRAREDEK